MKPFLTVFLLILTMTAKAQNREAIIAQFMEYSQLIIQKDFDRAVDLYANDELLKKVPRTDLIRMMQKMFSSPEIHFTVYPPENIELLPTFEQQKGKRYGILTYSQQINMKLPDPKKAQHDLILQALKQEFGSENVIYYQDSATYQIITHKKAVADSRDLQHWKFTVADKNAGALLREIYPEKVLKLVN